jgi:serralysin
LYNQQGQLISQTTQDKAVAGKSLWGGNGKDTLTGDAGNDKIVGKNGNDSLFGLAGNDKLVGGNGNDKLTGGAGGDILTGDCGKDQFVYTSLSDSLLSKRDVITDLQIGTDKIDSVNAVSAVNLLQLGTVASLNVSDIQAVLTSSVFVAKGGATFTLGSGKSQQTYLALNDDINGFSALTDAVIEITGYKGNLTSLAVV